MCREEEKEVLTGDLGRKLRKDMAQETNQSQAPLLCSTGCGSYGSSRNNGMCSLCHKDSLQRHNSNGCVSPPGSSTDSSTEECLQPQCPDSSPATISPADTESGHCSVPTVSSATSPEESTSGAKTSPTVNNLQSSEQEGQSSAGCSGTKLSTQRTVLRNGTSMKRCTHKSKKRKVEDSYENIDVKRASQAEVTVCTPVEMQRKAKRNRCFTCCKKVGLIGFDCRCGNVFCSMHRYSDIHNCTFDYKADAAEKIRKQNPVIVGEKIQKI